MGSSYRRGQGPHFAQVPFDLLDDEDADAYTIATYAALRSFADFGSAGGAEVSDARASARAGCGRRTFKRRREKLRKMGWIEWESGKDEGSKNTYVVHGSPVTPEKETGGVGHSGLGGRSERPRGVGQSGLPPNNSTENHNTEKQHLYGQDHTGPTAKGELLPKPSELDRNDYPPPWEEVWEAYPDRKGTAGKKAGYRKYRKCIKGGASHDELLSAARGYAEYCRSEGIVGSSKVRMARTFYGPDDWWREYVMDEEDREQMRREKLRKQGIYI